MAKMPRLAKLREAVTIAKRAIRRGEARQHRQSLTGSRIGNVIRWLLQQILPRGNRCATWQGPAITLVIVHISLRFDSGVDSLTIRAEPLLGSIHAICTLCQHRPSSVSHPDRFQLQPAA